MSSVTLRIPDSDASCEIELERGLTYSVTARTAAGIDHLLEQLLQAPGTQVADNFGGLVNNINILNNIVLPSTFHGHMTVAQAEGQAMDAFADCGVAGADAEALCGKWPAEASPFDRRLAGFVRSLIERPQLLVYKRFFEGLTRAEMARAAALNSVFRERHPAGTAVYLMLGDMPDLQPECHRQLEV